ncbi:DUF3331 domain-containing protein [Burkholderia catarinensis]|uniref:DUF3331 domain-containing protein n=1 Tax=Burkholderia catarinensis TaxID=1108140 RepID=UPI000913067C|nr:DUF3331 domain-containing protein [Burkholderia catarinensis]KAG8153768.1 hypothetical protein BFF94_010910 [Burkholderia catarinensis]
MDEFNRWEQMITLLGAPPAAGFRMITSGRGAGGISRPHRDAGPVPSSGSLRRRSSIVTAERQTDSSVLVSWSDPTRCRYDEQRWISAKCRRSGNCALTGQAIHTGDAIYKPQWRGERRPANSAEMILAVEMERFIVRMELA